MERSNVPSWGHPTWRVGHSDEQKVCHRPLRTSTERSRARARTSGKWVKVKAKGVVSVCPIVSSRKSRTHKDEMTTINTVTKQTQRSRAAREWRHKFTKDSDGRGRAAYRFEEANRVVSFPPDNHQGVPRGARGKVPDTSAPLPHLIIQTEYSSELAGKTNRAQSETKVPDRVRSSGQQSVARANWISAGGVEGPRATPIPGQRTKCRNLVFRFLPGQGSSRETTRHGSHSGEIYC